MMQSPSFLYIEDHAASRRVMELLMIQVLGYTQLTIMEDSSEVILRLEALNTIFDVIFLDLHLDPDDGYVVHGKLRAHDRFRSAKIIALTASVMPHDLDRIKEAGFDGVIEKPINQDTFPGNLQRILAGNTLWEED